MISEPLRRWDRWSRLAGAALIASLLVSAGSVIEAWRVDPLPSPAAPTVGGSMASGDAAPAARDAGDVETTSGKAAAPARADSMVDAAVAAAPFRPSREPPEERYALPDERSDETGARSSRVDLRLVGTAVRPSGVSLATFERPGASPTVMRAGGSIGGYRVTEVGPGRVRLIGNDTTLVLTVESPWSPDRGDGGGDT